MYERQGSQYDTQEHLSVINHVQICLTAKERIGLQPVDASVKLRDTIDKETKLYPNSACLLAIFSQMATVGFNYYSDGTREEAYDAYEKGTALAMGITDLICTEYGLDEADVRNLMVAHGTTRSDLDITDETSEEDARRSLSEAILQMGEEALPRLDESYMNLLQQLSRVLTMDITARRHFAAAFGLMFDSSLQAIAAGLSAKHDQLAQEVDKIVGDFDAGIEALLEAER